MLNEDPDEWPFPGVMVNSNILITSLVIQRRLRVNAVHVIVAVGIRSKDSRSGSL